jgi:hypothetical protein
MRKGTPCVFRSGSDRPRLFNTRILLLNPGRPVTFFLFSFSNPFQNKMLSLLTKNVFGRFMTQATTINNMMIVRGVASKPNKTAKLKGALKV